MKTIVLCADRFPASMIRFRVAYDSGGNGRCAMPMQFAAPRSTTHPDTAGSPRLEPWRISIMLRSLFAVGPAEPVAVESDNKLSHWHDDPAASRGM
jgi:hypothetical protein